MFPCTYVCIPVRKNGSSRVLHVIINQSINEGIYKAVARGVASLQLMGGHSILAPSRHSYNIRIIVKQKANDPMMG